MRRPAACLLVLSVLLATAPARAKDFTSPKNFKLTYPDDWTAATPEELAARAAKMKESAPGAAAPAATIRAPKEKIFTPNVCVTVVPMPMSLDDQFIKQLVTEMEGGLERAGCKMRAVKTTQMKVGKIESISIALEGSIPGTDEPARVWLVFVPGRTETYKVGCMALKSQWAKVVPSFAAVVKSLRVDINPFKGGLLTSPKGFSLRYPEGWAVASAERLAHWPSSQKPAAFLVGPPDQGGINPNLAVMVTPQKLPMDDKDPDFAKKFAKGYVQAFEKTYAQAGLTISNVEGIRMFAGKLPALSVTFDLTSSKTDKTARQWHVIVPGKTQGYLILCNASSPGWAKALPVFKRMLNSLKIDLEEAQ